MPPARGAGTVAGSICKGPADGLTVALLAVVLGGFGRESARVRGVPTVVVSAARPRPSQEASVVAFRAATLPISCFQGA